MKTKRQIRKDNGLPVQDIGHKNIEKVENSMEEYAEQQSTGFVEWLYNNDYNLSIPRFDLKNLYKKFKQEKK